MLLARGRNSRTKGRFAECLERHECHGDIPRIEQGQVAKRDERKDGLVRVIKKAMQTRIGTNAKEVLEALAKHGIAKTLARIRS
jgi:hypothetical protein